MKAWWLVFLLMLTGCAHGRKPEAKAARARVSDNVVESEVERLFQEKINYIQSLYKIRYDPYFGKPDKEENCLKGLDIAGQRSEGTDFRAIVFTLKANADFIYGLCDEERDIYFSELTYLYCKKSSRVIELKTFWPVREAKRQNLDLARECSNARI